MTEDEFLSALYIRVADVWIPLRQHLNAQEQENG